MYKIIEENYPYLKVNERLNGVNWLLKKNDYLFSIRNTTNDVEFFNALQDALSDLNNGHVHMINRKFYSYAKNVYLQYPETNEAWLNQLNNSKAIKRYSSETDIKNALQASSNSKTLNNIETQIIRKGHIAYLSIHSFNSFNIDEDMKKIKPFLEDIKDYKSLIIDIRGNSGGDSRYWSDNIVPMVINKPLESTNYYAYRGGDFVEQFVKCRKGFGYEKLELISSISEDNLKNLPPELKEDFKYYSRETTYIEPKNSIGFKGEIYLLVDGNVFSSSEAFATFAKNTSFATLIGETTGGDGIGEDPAICVLPNSGYAFRFTKEMGLTGDGTCNFEHKTEPDIRVTAKKGLSLSDDTAIQTVLKLIN